MNRLKNQNGFISVVIMIIVCLITIVCLYFVLDIYGFIEVPEEYSIGRFLKPTEDFAIQTEIYSTDNTNIRTRIDDSINYSDANTDLGVDDSNRKNENGNGNENQPVYTNIDTNRFYYSQLDDVGKKIYNKVVAEKENLKKGNYSIDFGKDFNKLLNSDGGEETLNASFQSAMNAVLLDNPDIFFIDITKMYLLTHSTTYAFTGTTYEVSIGANDNGGSYLNDDFDEFAVEVADTKLKSLKNVIINKLSGNDLDKIKQIHDYLIDNLEYDSTFSNPQIYNIYGALINNNTVCEGYAKAFKYLLDEAGIPCVMICGTAQNSKGEIENHAWNYVFIDGNWYAIDVTWDDPIVVGGGRLSDESKYKYYLRGSDSLFVDHEENGNVVKDVYFTYPKLSSEDY